MPGDSHVDQPSPYGVCLASSLLMIDSVPFLPRNHMSIEYGVDGCRIGLPRPFSSRLTGIHPASLGGGGGGGGGIITLKSLVANDLPPSPPPSLPKLCVTPLLRVQMPYASYARHDSHGARSRDQVSCIFPQVTWRGWGSSLGMVWGPLELNIN